MVRAVKKSSSYVQVLFASAWCSAYAVAAAGLQEPSLRAGSASFHLQDPSNAVIHQTSSKAIIDWRAFSLAPADRLTFVQPNKSAIALNRVTGAQASAINGQLFGNGQVWLLNPNGVLIGKTGQVNTHGFLATTMGLTYAHFLEGRYVFQEDEAHAVGVGLLNQGSIVSGTGGYALLTGSQVRNTGLIQAELGHVVLGAGREATLDLVGDGLLKFAVNAPVIDTEPASGAYIENTQSGQLLATQARQTIKTLDTRGDRRLLFNLSVSF